VTSADPALRTIYLGQFEHAHADAIAAALEYAGIAWTYKQFGAFTRFFFAGEWGVRLYVDARRAAEAATIAASVPEPPPARG
jgi:hypothetical protein